MKEKQCIQFQRSVANFQRNQSVPSQNSTIVFYTGLNKKEKITIKKS